MADKNTPEAKFIIKDLNLLIESVMTEFGGIPDTDLPALLRGFKALKEFKEEIDAAAEIVSKFYNQLSYERIPKAFEAEGVDSIKLAGRNFVVGVRLNASIPQNKKEVGHKWLEEHGLGALIQPSVNPKTLSSAIAAYVETTAEEPPAEAMSLHKQTYTSVRKA